MANTWQEKRSFEETNYHMLNDSVLCDVTFLMGADRIEVKAHKFMLASRSPVFYAMFCGELSETSDRIEIKDIQAETMNMLLRFIYTEDCSLTGDSIMALWYAAKKYQVKRLEQKCQSFLSDQICTENVCDIFSQVHMFNEIEIKEKCFKFILINGKKVIQTEGFTALPKELLREILESNDLEAPETDIYDGCKKWATCQLLQSDGNREITHSDIRNILGNLLYLIRFPTMSIEDFTAKCSEDDILASDEKVSIFQFIGGRTNGKVTQFRSKKRSSYKKQIITRLPQATGICTWKNSGQAADAISFTVSHTAMFWGIGLFTPASPGKVEGTVSLLGTDQSVIVDRQVVVEYSQNAKTEILFDEGVLLEPGVTYTITVLLAGQKTYSGVYGKQYVTVDDFSVTFSNSNKNANGTNTDQGQIPFLILGIKKPTGKDGFNTVDNRH